MCEPHIKGQTLRVIDTPGIPDPSNDRTIAYFNRIVINIRSLNTLSLLIFLVQEGRTNKRQYNHYRTLLTQFNYIPCEKLMVCRQSDYARRPTAAIRAAKRNDGKLFVEDILTNSGMNMPYMLQLGGTSQEAEDSLTRLVDYADGCQRQSLGDCPFLRTVEEHKTFVDRLLSKLGRATALKEQLEGYAIAVRYHENWKVAHSIVGLVGEGLAFSTLGLSGFGTAAAAGLILVTDINIRNVKDKKAKAQEELDSNVVNEDLVRDATQTLDGLNGLVD